MKARAEAHRKRRREEVRCLIRAAKDRPCCDCGVRYPPYVMQFDHRRGEKSFTVGDANTRGMPLAKVEREIAKCDVVCANCHAERTYQRGQRFTVRLVGAPAHDGAGVLF